MCRTRVDLLVTAGAAVRLSGRDARHRAYHPVTIRPLFDPLGPERRGRGGGPGSPGLSRTHDPQAYRGCGVVPRMSADRTGVRLAGDSHYSDVSCGSSSPGAASTMTAGSPLIS